MPPLTINNQKKTYKDTIMAYTLAKEGRHRTAGRFIRRKVTFTTSAKPGAVVFLSGTFNDWKTDGRQMRDVAGNGVYSCVIYVIPGTYEYKFIVDGQWVADMDNPHSIPNGMDSENSVATVI